MAKRAAQRKVLVVTGTRAEFGLLLPVMRAIQKNKKLALHVVATGSHLLPPARTVREVKAAFPRTITVPMQRAGKSSRLGDAAATARGIEGLTRVIARLKPDWVVVLGDRIEAFAAASAASIAGIAVCHIHGGDRAEGIADEAMRHAITKLCHLHCAATEQSRDRIVKMGERPEHVFNTGSPAIDDLRTIKPLDNRTFKLLGSPRVVALVHPSGLQTADEERLARGVVWALHFAVSSPVLVLAPNHDPGRELIIRAFGERPPNWTLPWSFLDHLPRAQFLSLLKRLAGSSTRGVLIGNSSAGLIEAAVLGVPVVNVGPRQDGRERGGNVLDVPYNSTDTGAWIQDGLVAQLQRPHQPRRHPFGDGRAGPRIAALLARLDPQAPALLRKRNAY